MGIPVHQLEAQGFDAAGNIMKGRDGLVHAERPITRSGRFVQQPEFVPDELPIAATAAGVSHQSFQQLNGLIRMALFFTTERHHHAGIDEEA